MSKFVDKNRQLADSIPAPRKVAIAHANHIWISALSAVHPSPQMLQEIGQMVVNKVLESDVQDNLGVGFPVTWIEVNAS